MNKELFDSMQKQMAPSPEVRAALSEKLAQTHKKRPVPWKKYTALAACAALVIGAFSVYNFYQDKENWTIVVRNFQHDVIVETPGPLHSYVMVEGLTGYATEDATVNDKGSGGDVSATEVLTGSNTGDLPGGAYVGDAPAQEEAIQAYDKLAPHIRSHPDWYGGAYIDNTGTLIVCLVESQDPGDKSLELQVLEWTGNDRVGFTSGKYSLGYLLDLQKKVCDALYYDLGLGFSCGTNEELNRLELTLPEVTDEALVLLAELDPDDDAIYVQVGKRVSLDDTAGEDPAVHHVVPGGTTAPVPEDDNLIADEPYYDGAHYDVENLPEELPQKKQPAFVETDSVPEEDASTSCWFPEE